MPQLNYRFRILLTTGLILMSGPVNAQTVKNVIMLIGDGMGPQQVTLGLVYARQSPDSPYKKSGLHIERMMREGKTGFMLTYPEGAIVVDSAASATQLSTGHFSGSEMIGVDYQGNKRPSILQKAKSAGKATGLVSSARLTHATPAAFAAHQPHRSLERQIAEDILKSGPDVLLSAGLPYFLPASVEKTDSEAYKKWRARIPNHLAKLESSRGDERDLLIQAEKDGYQLVFDHPALQASSGTKVLGLFENWAMPNGIIEAKAETDEARAVPTLRDMTKKAIEILAKDKDGFFLMVEGGQIDWAGHSNDAGTMLNEVLQFDKAIGEVLDFAAKSGDTLVILTADHETGSFGFSYSKQGIPAPRKLAGDAFKEALFAPQSNFGDPLVLQKLRAQKMATSDIIMTFDKLPAAQKTPEIFAKMVTENVGFPLTKAEAEEILEGKKKDPSLLAVMSRDYGSGSDLRTNLVGRALSTEQQVVWGTGTHTMTFVPLVIFGPEPQLRRFSGVMHSTEVSQAAIKSLGLSFP